MDDYLICEYCGMPIMTEPVWIRKADGARLCICEDCTVKPDLWPSSPEMDDLIAWYETEMREREELKFELLSRLEERPADDPLWDEIARRLGAE